MDSRRFEVMGPGDGPIRPTLQNCCSASVVSFVSNDPAGRRGPDPYFCPYISVASPLPLPRHRHDGRTAGPGPERERSRLPSRATTN